MASMGWFISLANKICLSLLVMQVISCCLVWQLWIDLFFHLPPQFDCQSKYHYSIPGLIIKFAYGWWMCFCPCLTVRNVFRVPTQCIQQILQPWSDQDTWKAIWVFTLLRCMWHLPHEQLQTPRGAASSVRRHVDHSTAKQARQKSI